MSDVLINQVAKVAQQAAEQNNQGPTAASAEDKARFNEAMQTDSTSRTQQVDGAQQAQQEKLYCNMSEAPQATGSRILDNLDRMSSDFMKLKNDVLSSAEKHGEMGDIIRLQMKVAEVTTTQTLVGKSGEKSGQGVNQLVRGQ